MSDQDAAPDVAMPQAPPPSVLGQTVSEPMPALNEQGTGASQDDSLVPSGGSRLQSILGAVAKVVTTGLSGIPAGNRPSFLGGLGQGARAAQAADATQQAIKFRTFDDSVRAANLHLQDQELQLRTQEQSDAHQKAEDFQADYDEAHGITNTTHPNVGDAVTQTWQGQQAAQGSVSIQHGTSLLADGKSISIPGTDPDTQAGQLQKYKDLQSVLPFLSTLPQNAQFVPAKFQDQLTHIMGGYDVHGDPLTHDQLTNLLPALQSQRDAAAKNGSTPYQLGTLDRLIGIYKANEKNHQNADDIAAAHQVDVQAASNKQLGGVANDLAVSREKALLPIKLQEEKAKQAVTDGDPNALAQLLVNGDVAPSQVISSRKPEVAQQAFTAAKKANPNWNAQQAEGYFKAASSGGNVQFFGSANSLLDQDGTLNQLQQNFNALPNGKIPAFNKVSDWTAAASGSGATAAFAQTALGVADDYAKVMGGGTGTDAARNSMLESFARSSSPEAMKSAIAAARAAVTSQTSARIGTNPVMRKMYGQNLPTPSQGQQTQAGQSGLKVSLAAARQLPAMQGKSDDQITAAIQAQGHQVIQ
jgi:hypothetical protein